MKLQYELYEKLEISASILYQMGLVPILTQLVIYEIIADNGSGSYVGAAYITSKGDAIKFLIGLDYKIPLKKTN